MNPAVQTRLLGAASLAGIVLLVAACGGGGGSSAAGVASLGQNAGPDPTTTVAGSAEDQMLKYVQCLRDQGLNVPDPTVDANGNIQFRPFPRDGNDGNGANGGNASAATSTPPSTIDRQAFQKARQACGNPPNAVGGFNRDNSQAFQDAALKFAACMREQGIDVPDPDF